MSIEVRNLRPVVHNARVGRSYPRADVSGDLPGLAYHSRDVEMVGNRITPELLTSMIQERNLGHRMRWVDFADEQVRNNLHLLSQKRLAEQQVSETDFRVTPGDDSAPAGKAADACTQLARAWMRNGLRTWLEEIAAAEYYGAAAHEVVWVRNGREVIPAALVKIDERRLSYACDYYDPEPYALRLWDEDNQGEQPHYGTPLYKYGEGKILAHEPRVLGGLRTTEGLFSALVWYSVFTVWTWRDLMALNEMIGRPPVVAYYAAGGARGNRDNEFNGARNATPPEIDAGKGAVFALSGSLRAVLPDTVRLEALKFPIPTGEPVQLLTEARANALVSKAWHGTDTVSDLKPGSRAAQEVQERTGDTPYRARCWRAASALAQLFDWYVRANPSTFGAECPPPNVEPDVEPAVDRLVTAQGVSEAMRAGLKVPTRWAYRALQIPEPKQGEETLQPKEPAPKPAPTDPNEPGETPPDDGEKTPTEDAPDAAE